MKKTKQMTIICPGRCDFDDHNNHKERFTDFYNFERLVIGAILFEYKACQKGQLGFD